MKITHLSPIRIVIFRSQDEERDVLDRSPLADGTVGLTYWESYPMGHRRSSGWLVYVVSDNMPDYFIPRETPDLDAGVLRGALDWLASQ